MPNAELMQWFGFGAGAGVFLSVLSLGYELVRKAFKHTVNDA